MTVAALPPQVASDDLRRPTSFLDPYFSQDWRLFAPNPIGADRSFLVQGSFRTEAGAEESAWLDVTDAELGLVRRQLLGGRAGYGSLKMVLGLDSWWSALGTAARESIEGLGSADEPAARDAVRHALADDDTPPGTVEGYLDYDESALRLASDVLRAERPDDELVGVRYRVRLHPVGPWSARDAQRPEPTDRTVGWTVPAAPEADRSDAVADFWERRR